MKLNTIQIEKLSVSALNDAIMKCDSLQPEINQGDREPCLDGNVLVYSTNQFCKKNLLGAVRVQVKGTANSSHFKKEKRSNDVLYRR